MFVCDWAEGEVQIFWVEFRRTGLFSPFSLTIHNYIYTERLDFWTCSTQGVLCSTSLTSKAVLSSAVA